MRHHTSVWFILAAALMLPVSTAHAVPLTFTANLSAANEVPPPVVISSGTGLATIILDPTAHTLQVNATFSGLTSNTVAAHIHCCAPLGTNAGVATTVPAFPGFPIVANGNGVTAGMYSSAVFDLTQSLIYNPAFVTAQGGLTGAEAALVAGIVGGMSYFNIHTVNFTGGEIRGQLNAVPLPSALPLFATGLGALGLLSWRRKRKATAGF
jgi:hypothetical protein